MTLAFGIERVSKMGDWKNITQRQTEARDGRRGKKQGAAVAGAGAGLAAAGAAAGGKDAAKYVGNAGKNYYARTRSPFKATGLDGPAVLKSPFSDTSAKAGLKSAKSGVKGAFKALPSSKKTALGVGAAGAALAGAGAAKYGAGLAKEKYNDKKITDKRRARDKVKKSAFGVDHAHEVSKGAWGNAAEMTTGKALKSGQQMANKAAPKVKTGAVKAKSFAQGAAGKLPTDPGAGKAGNAFRQKVKQNPMKATVGAAGVGGTAMGLKPKKQQA